MTARTDTRRRARPHPRVQQRRAEIRRAQGRRRTRLAAGVLVAFSFGGLGWLVVQSGLLDVDGVTVEGVRHTRPADVRRVAGVRHGDPLLLVDRGGVEQRVERLPWVAEAKASLDLPGRLVVSVVERAPAAWLARPEGGVAVVDGEARVLQHRGEPPARVAELRLDATVPEPGHRLDEGRGAVTIAAAVPPGVRDRLLAVEPERGGWVLRLDGVETVRFGPATEVAEKWAALEAVLTELGEAPVAMVDVRVPAVPAVRRSADLGEGADESEPPATDGDGGPPPSH